MKEKFIVLLFYFQFFNMYSINANEYMQLGSSYKGYNGKDIAFINIGKYRGNDDKGSEYQKSYFLSRYIKLSWAEAKSFCKAFDLDLASFETLTEAQNFLDITQSNEHFKDRDWYLIDGITLKPKSKDEWYWTNSGNKIVHALPWMAGQPDCAINREFCMSIGKFGSSGFNDYPCTELPAFFICQNVDFNIY